MAAHAAIHVFSLGSIQDVDGRMRGHDNLA